MRAIIIASAYSRTTDFCFGLSSVRVNVVPPAGSMYKLKKGEKGSHERPRPASQRGGVERNMENYGENQIKIFRSLNGYQNAYTACPAKKPNKIDKFYRHKNQHKNLIQTMPKNKKDSEKEL